jgi:hypothetical protein
MILKKRKNILLIFWVFINTFLLILSGNYYFGYDDWYPVDKYRMSGPDVLTSDFKTELNFDPFWSYDLSEFCIYIIVPVILIIIFKNIKNHRI